MPGFVVDKYDDFLVVQFLTAGAEAHRGVLIRLLVDAVAPTGIVERSDMPVRRLEGLPLRSGVVHGETPSKALLVTENGLRFEVDIIEGQKTGFYLDQRENRSVVCSETFVGQKDLLNVFSYTGGFAVYAARSGAASIVNIDA